MKKIHRVLAMLMAAIMALSLITTAFAEPTIDTSKKASLSIYKYDITTVSAEGAWDAESYVSTGLHDDAVIDKLSKYAIQGVEFTYLKVTDITTSNELLESQRQVGVLYGFDGSERSNAVLSAIGLTAADAHKTDNGVNYFTSDMLNNKLAAALAANATTVKNALEAAVKNGGVAMTETDATGHTSASNMEQGLYLVVETRVPENVTSTCNPFFVSLPMTTIDGAAWNYDVTVYPKNQTGKELSFLPINARDEFDVLRRQLQGEDFTQLYLDEELQLAEQMFPPPEAEEVKRLLQSRAELSDVRRAAAIYKLQRYSYNGNGDSYGVSSCDIQRFFRDIWECSHRLKDVALENKDFESIITAHNDPQTTVYCDPPYYEAERYAVEFPRSDHQRLHDVLAQHRGFAMVSYNNCDYIRRLYEDFFIYEVERPNSQSKKKNDIYREYIMTNYDPRVFASQMTIFGDYSSDGKICRLVHIPERPLRT